MLSYKVISHSDKLAQKALRLTENLITALENDLKKCPYPEMAGHLATQLYDAASFYHDYQSSSRRQL
jgi:hypothetical protein